MVLTPNNIRTANDYDQFANSDALDGPMKEKGVPQTFDSV